MQLNNLYYFIKQRYFAININYHIFEWIKLGFILGTAVRIYNYISCKPYSYWHLSFVSDRKHVTVFP